jgi:hypothetical protein
MTSYNRLVGGVRIPNQVAHMLAENGIWDAKRIEWNSQGGIKRFDGNPLKDMATFSRDPVEFYEKNILPMYARMNGGKGLDVSERARENTMLFGRTGGAMFSLIDRQLATIHRSVGAWEKALGADASAKLAGTTLAGKEVDLHAKWAKVLNDLGNTVLPYAISGVEKLTGALRWFDGWINRNETAVKWLSGALAVLAGGLMMRGSVLLLSAAFRGLGLAMMFQAAGGVKTLMTGIAGLASPIGIAVLALGTLAAAAYAFRPFTKNEVDAQRRDGAHLTSGAKERMKALGWASEEKLTQDAVRLKNLKDSSIGSNIATHGAVLGITHYLADRARLAFGTPSAVAAGQQRPVVVRAGGNDRPAAAPAPYAASKPQPVQVVSNTYLDGRLISQNVVERMVQESMRPAGGLSGVDPRMSFASPSMAR